MPTATMAGRVPGNRACPHCRGDGLKWVGFDGAPKWEVCECTLPTQHERREELRRAVRAQVVAVLHDGGLEESEWPSRDLDYRTARIMELFDAYKG